MIDLSDPSSLRAIEGLPRMLRKAAADRSSHVMAVFESGAEWTWADGLHHAETTAARLRKMGVRAGDNVALMVGNGENFLKLWWGAALLGAVLVPFNTNLRGATLLHVRTVAAAKLTIIDRHFKDRFEGPESVDGEKVIHSDQMNDIEPAAVCVAEIDAHAPWKPHVIIFTSGTTGPAKASVTSFVQLLTTTTYLHEVAGLSADDRLLVDLPLYHLAAMSTVLSILAVGGSIAVYSVPRLSNYWERALSAGATVAMLVGGMTQVLMGQRAGDADLSHRLRLLICAPLPHDADAFKSRFGVADILTAYGSTEVNTPILLPPDVVAPPNACGKVRRGFEIRLVDAFDMPVSPGAIGEAIIRCQSPWTMSSGYLGMAEETRDAWRNGWFHTGDMFRQDEHGFFYFHDRVKDSLRRRGENISSFEVEREVMAHPMVREAACIGIKSEDGSEDEVKVFVNLHDDVELDMEDLYRFLARKMPHFMVPRYLEVSADFPKTSSSRVKKNELRDRGNSGRTWDSVAAGLKVNRGGEVVSFLKG